MAKHKGSNERRFIDMYESQARDIQRKMFDYIKLLHKPEGANRIDRPDLVIRTQNGFPVMPDVMDDVVQKKSEIEDLLRRYLNAQYSKFCYTISRGLGHNSLTGLASGQRRSHVPFGSLKDSSDDFIDDRYVPEDFIWKDPRNMTKATILRLFEHIRMRQERYGPENAFRFRQYCNGGGMVIAEYGTRANDEKAADRARKQKASRGRSKKGKGKATAAIARNRSEAHTHDPTEAHPQDESSITQSAEHDNNDMIDPALLHNHEVDQGIIVNDIQMQVLLSHGYPPAIPINGPNDGPPQYQFPTSALDILNQPPPATNGHPQPPPTNEHPRPRPTGRTITNATQDLHPQPPPTNERPRPRPTGRTTTNATQDLPEGHEPITEPRRRSLRNQREQDVTSPLRTAIAAKSTRKRVREQPEDSPTDEHPRRSGRNHKGKDQERRGAKRSKIVHNKTRARK
jgi:hypothetical protein